MSRPDDERSVGSHWRGLEELASSETFRERLAREFPALPPWPGGPDDGGDEVGRRRFLQLMGASMALAGLGACTRQPKETIAPYSEAPESIVPGQPLLYATAVTLRGLATGVLVETHEGRPTKVEGNPDHPSSLGAADVFAQAAILGLYDPDRSRTATYLGDIRPWGDLVGILREAMKAQEARRGAGVRILTETVTSPTLMGQIRRLLVAYPEARWHQYEPVARDNHYEGARLAFGAPVETLHRLAEADVILALDADFLSPGADGPRLIREFAARRRPDAPGSGAAGHNRLYVVESMPSNTGAKADHRLPLRSSDIEGIAWAVAAAVGLLVPAPHPEAHAAWVAAVARDLLSHRGRCLVLAGDGQPPVVHALTHAINASLGNAGATLTYHEPVVAEAVDQIDSLRSLTDQMAAGQVELLIVLGGNPVYDAPSDIPFAEALNQVGLRAHLSLYHDETSALCHWHVPMAHELESWSDARAADGTATILQPLIEPLYEGRTTHDLLAALLGDSGRSSHELVREHWRARAPGGEDFERWWRRALHEGTVAGTASPERKVTLLPDCIGRLQAASTRSDLRDGLEIVFRPDAAIHDGRFANNGWLQELPRPITRLTWDNAALMAPAAAEGLGAANGDLVELRLEGRSIVAPVWIVPGHARESVTIHLGYGRRRAGGVAEGAGVDAYPLRTTAAPWFSTGLEVRRLGGHRELACTQTHHSMEGRQHAREATLEHFRQHPDFARHVPHAEDPGPEMSIYPRYKYEGHAWGMAIDLNACVGCNACVIGCQSENNIPVVGQEQVARGREMHWIRVDRYFEGTLDEPRILNQPVPCMHCEQAPCEPVCPVGATVHSSEGLNDMVYNRCVGTRYCSNNCPYKVRRFNFLLYQDWSTPSLKMLRNPDVTVRSRGVMEKCTYCVQRINRARIQASNEGRPIRDGDILTACQQACPAQAIVFGDINDPESRVAKMKADPRNYGLLAEIGTRPRTTYLAGLRNPNPDLEKA